MNDYKNILIIRTDRIGDVILTTPAIEAIRKNFPQAKITVMVAPVTRDLLLGNPFIDEVMVDDREGRHHGMAGFWQLACEVHEKRFDAVFVFHTKKRTNFLCFNARIPERIGYNDKNYGFFLTQGIPDDRHAGEKHESELCLDLLRAVGLRVDNPGLHLPFQPSAEQWAEVWLRKNNLSPRDKLVVLHPGASDVTKCWPASCFARLIDAMAVQGCHMIVVGHGPTVQIAHDIRALAKMPFFDLTGQTSVAEMASLLKRCQLLISNDSGPVHVGAAAGIYVISLFLRDQPGINPERWRPLGPKGFILANKPLEAIKLDASGGVVSGVKDSIEVSEVLQLANRLLQKP
jgi:heptosyltransferase II